MTHAQYTHLLSVIADLAGDVHSHEGRLDSLEARMGRLEIRMDRLETRMDNLEARMDKLEARMDRLEARMDSLETELRAGFASVHESIQEVLNAMAGPFHDHERRITKLEQASNGRMLPGNIHTAR